ncbi:AraC-like DNA-binding protein [Nitrobacteraceae bacterium AZCC 1564]
MSPLLNAVRNYAEDHADQSGIARTPIRGLSMVRATGRGGIARSLPRPLVCLVVQGAKHVTLGAKGTTVEAGDSMLMSAGAPTVSQVISASSSRPYFAIAMELDPALTAELSAEIVERQPSGIVPVAQSRRADAEVLDSALRLVRLLEHPDAVPVLSSQTIREMHYWLLIGRHGPAIQALDRLDSSHNKVSRAVALLRAEFARPVTIKRLADAAGMSPSAFHRHFKAATSLTPMQFQKQLRLREARRIMMSEAASASAAAFSVGYESVSQFTREYRRAFGLPPARDVEAAKVRSS